MSGGVRLFHYLCYRWYPSWKCWWTLYHLKLSLMGYILVADCLCLSPLCSTWWAAKVGSHGNGEKYVIEFGTNRMGVYDLLLVTNSNNGYRPLSRTFSKLRWCRRSKINLQTLHVSFNVIARADLLRICWWTLYCLKLGSTDYISVADCVCLSPLCFVRWAAKLTEVSTWHIFTLMFWSLSQTFVRRSLFSSSFGSCNSSDVTW